MTVVSPKAESSGLSPAELNAFQRCGRALFFAGLNNSHSGNLSFRQGDQISVTATGSMLHELEPESIVITSFEPTDAERKRVSREFVVHRAIYESTDYAAVVHCHPLYALALSLVEDAIEPLQIDGHGALPGYAPVIEVDVASASPELCEAVASAMTKVPAVVIRGHGAFVAGADLDQATHRAFVLENAAQVICTTRALGGDLEALRAKPYLKSGYRRAEESAS